MHWYVKRYLILSLFITSCDILAMLFGDDLPRTPTHIGCIDPHCNVLNVVKDSFESARFLCEQYYMTAPDVEYETVNCKFIRSITIVCLIHAGY